MQTEELTAIFAIFISSMALILTLIQWIEKKKPIIYVSIENFYNWRWIVVYNYGEIPVDNIEIFYPKKYMIKVNWVVLDGNVEDSEGENVFPERGMFIPHIPGKSKFLIPIIRGSLNKDLEQKFDTMVKNMDISIEYDGMFPGYRPKKNVKIISLNNSSYGDSRNTEMERNIAPLDYVPGRDSPIFSIAESLRMLNTSGMPTHHSIYMNNMEDE